MGDPTVPLPVILATWMTFEHDLPVTDDVDLQYADDETDRLQRIARTTVQSLCVWCRVWSAVINEIDEATSSGEFSVSDSCWNVVVRPLKDAVLKRPLMPSHHPH